MEKPSQRNDRRYLFGGRSQARAIQALHIVFETDADIPSERNGRRGNPQFRGAEAGHGPWRRITPAGQEGHQRCRFLRTARRALETE